MPKARKQFRIIKTAPAAAAIKRLRGAAKAAYERHERELESQGCRAGGYRLLAASGDFSDLCSHHLYRHWRLITSFNASTVFHRLRWVSTTTRASTAHYPTSSRSTPLVSGVSGSRAVAPPMGGPRSASCQHPDGGTKDRPAASRSVVDALRATRIGDASGRYQPRLGEHTLAIVTRLGRKRGSLHLSPKPDPKSPLHRDWRRGIAEDACSSHSRNCPATSRSSRPSLSGR